MNYKIRMSIQVHPAKRRENQASRPIICSMGGSMTKIVLPLKPGCGSLRRSSRPSWQRAQRWQKKCVAKSQVDSHCSRCSSSSIIPLQHPHDLLNASQLPSKLKFLRVAVRLGYENQGAKQFHPHRKLPRR